MHLWAHHASAASVDDEALRRATRHSSVSQWARCAKPRQERTTARITTTDSPTQVRRHWRRQLRLLAARPRKGPKEGSRGGGGGAEARGGGACGDEGQREGRHPRGQVRFVEW